MTGNLRRSFAAVALAGLVALAPAAPVYGQAGAPSPAQQQTPPPTPASTQPLRPLRIPIGTDYSQERPFFPSILLPYK